MQVDHTHYEFPEQIGPLRIKPITWQHFKATPPLDSPFLAHIYWSVNYEFGSVSQGKPKVKVAVNVRPKSWKKVEQLQLLQHEYGHYLIGCLCGLSFVRKVNYDLVWNPQINFGNWCKQILNQCLSEYCAKQRLYDQQTEHYMNKQMQAQWQIKLRDQFLIFDRIFKSKEQKKLKAVEENLAQASNSIRSVGGLDRIKVSSVASKKFKLRKQLTNGSLKLKQKQTSLSKKSFKSTKQIHQKTEVNTSKTNIVSSTYHLKRMKENDSSDVNRMPSIPKKSTNFLRALSIRLKPL